MKNITVARLLLLISVVVVLFTLSCATKEITKVVTVSNVVPTTVQGVVTTVAAQPTVVSPVFQNPPPDIPHVYVITEMGNPYIGGLIADSGAAICFECHGMPTQHEIWRYDPNICLDCHRISPNPRLNP